MAEMTFTEARIALEQFVRAYKAANMLGAAMEAASNMERRAAEVQNNLEHLLKEQDAQQANLDAMGKEAEERFKQAVAQHQKALGIMQKERDDFTALAQSEREAAQKAKAAEQDRLDAFMKGHNDRMESLTAERGRLEAEIAAMQAQADEIKAKMRVFVS